MTVMAMATEPIGYTPSRLHQRSVKRLTTRSRFIDTQVKRERFERAGTPAFWVVDPVARPAAAALIVWELNGDAGYREVAKVVGEESVEATVPYPVTVVAADMVR